MKAKEKKSISQRQKESNREMTLTLTLTYLAETFCKHLHVWVCKAEDSCGLKKVQGPLKKINIRQIRYPNKH